MGKELEKKYLEVLEKQDWSVSSYTDDGRVELEKYSPAGEDFLMCVNVENFPEAVMGYYESFDIDDHIEMWVEAKKNGVKQTVQNVELYVGNALSLKDSAKICLTEECVLCVH